MFLSLSLFAPYLPSAPCPPIVPDQQEKKKSLPLHEANDQHKAFPEKDNRIPFPTHPPAPIASLLFFLSQYSSFILF